MLALLISAVYNTVDKMFVGNYVGDLGLVALSIFSGYFFGNWNEFIC